MKQLKITELITRRDSESISRLFHDINRLSVPTTAEEEALALRIAQGDEEARNELVARNLRFVISVAKQSQGLGLELGDLISEGAIGLLEATKRFDITRGFKFCTYAVWWIRQAINRAIGEYGTAIRVPGNQRTNRNKLNRIKNEFLLTNCREPSCEELAEIAQLDPALIADIEVISTQARSLDQPFGEDSDNLCLNDTLASDSRADELVDGDSLKADIQRVLNKLNERERNILTWSLGLGDITPRPVEEIAYELGLSQERVRQIAAKAVSRIRNDRDSVNTLKQYAAA